MCLNTLWANIQISGIPVPLSGTERVRIALRMLAPVALLCLTTLRATPVHASGGPGAEPVLTNDNTRPAGRIGRDTLTIRLRAGAGQWRPEGPDGPALIVEALGEEDAALTVPAPLIRVTEGVVIEISIRNDLDAPLRVHGMCTRDGSRCTPVDVQPGTTRSLRFISGDAGTYHYWATTVGVPFPVGQMAGALIIDPAGAAAPPDRILVITEWNDLTQTQIHQILSADGPSEQFVALSPRLTFVINGLSWPATERLTYRRGDTAQWRVINLTSQSHPMHLHGFYFTVFRTGDGRRDEPVGGTEGRQVVTHVLPSGGTMFLKWTAEREGNWLFHCHIMAHVSPARRLAPDASSTDAHAGHLPHHQVAHDPSLGMAGLVLGVTVLSTGDAKQAAARPRHASRQLTMIVDRVGDDPHGESAIGIAISDQQLSPTDVHLSFPGPPLVLRRGEPVEITVVNRLLEPTSIHWHGLEIDSYYDGVHGWSGIGRQTAPMIAPGGSFRVRITPPRAGTFIYHTHLHDYRQLASGLYGALIVTDANYDPAVDHVVVLGRRDASEVSGILEDAASIVVNGERAPRWVWRANERHRIRLINITPDDVLDVSLVQRDAVLVWRPVMKDGAPVPSGEREPVPARVRIAVGETYDFDYEAPSGRDTFWLEVRSTSGKWQAQGQVLVK